MLLNFFTNLAENKKADIQILPQLINSNIHDMKAYDYRHTTIRECDISLHLDFINPIGLSRPKINILITSLHKNIEAVVPYLDQIQYVLCKTQEAMDYFGPLKKDWGFTLKFLGWSSFDKLNNRAFSPKRTKQYYTFLTGQTDLDYVISLLDKWPAKKPLHIYSGLTKEQLNNQTSRKMLEIVTHCNGEYHETIENDVSKDSIFIHLDKEPFDYALLSEASTGSVLITSNIDLVSTAHKQYIYQDLDGIIRSVISVENLATIEEASQASRAIFINNQNDFLMEFTQIFLKIFKPLMPDTEGEADKSLEKIEEDNPQVEPATGEILKPLVSIITPTYNRAKLFEIAKYNWSKFTYENREWIIVDDSPEPLAEILNADDERITYIYVGPERLTIGAKRNLAIKYAKGDYLMSMDDDDFYPSDTIERKLAILRLNPTKECCYSSSIACYNIYRNFSFINTPSIYDPPHKRVAEATLFFKRKFWEVRPFPEVITKGEGENFIEGRYKQCLEIDWVGSIISLIHNSNISQKLAPDNEPNGNHFMNENWGLTEEFVKLLEKICEQD